MDEVLKAVTGLINTGGALADDALYLYFLLKFIEPVSIGLTVTSIVYIICRTILKSNGK